MSTHDFDLFVIGGGSGGVRAARMAAGRGARVALAGMRLPPNYGPYANDFQRSFVDIAKTKKTPLVEFLLEESIAYPEAKKRLQGLDTLGMGREMAKRRVMRTPEVRAA